MGDANNYDVRPMRRSETSFVKGLLKETQGAMGTKEEIDTWRNVDGDAFFVAVHEGKIVACCVAYRLGDKQGHIGMVLMPAEDHISVLPALVKSATQKLENRKITLNCHIEMKNVFQNLGFKEVSSSTWLSCTLKSAKDLKVYRATHVYRSLALTEHTMIERVLDFDATLHAYDNRAILKNTLLEPNCVARVFVGNKEVSGYGCLRRLYTGGWRVSPIVCEDGGGALCLMQDLLLSLTSVQLEEGVTFFIASDNEVAIDLATTMGFSIDETNERVTVSNQSISGPTPDFIFTLHSPTFCVY